MLGELVAVLPDLEDGVVLGLVRGGVPVAYEVARACGLPMDILVVRKLGCRGGKSWRWARSLAAGAWC